MSSFPICIRAMYRDNFLPQIRPQEPLPHLLTCCIKNNATSLCYEGKSISKLQIVIEKRRMGIITYKQHLFFNVISKQI
jgi:hypothetical protein